MALWNDVGTRYIHQTFSPGEGVDLVRSPLQLSDTQAADMLDGSPRQHPGLRSRDGRSQVDIPVEEYSIRAIHCNPVGRIYIMAGDATGSGQGNEWYTNLPTSTTAIRWTPLESDPTTDTTWEYSMADWFDYTAGVWYTYSIRYEAGVGYGIAWTNGSTVSRLSAATYPCVAGPICSHVNRLFTTPDNANGNLGFSKLFDPSVWTSPDGGILAVGNNANVKSLISLSDRLFIGTDSGIYALFGQDEENFTVQTISTELSVPTGYHAVKSNDSVFFSDGFDIYEYTNGSVRNITRSMSGNGVLGGFPEVTRTSISSTTDRRIQSMGADISKVICSTNIISSLSSSRNLWYVFDIKRRRWFIEEGTRVNYETPYTSFALTPNGRILCSSLYTSATTIREYPTILELDNGLAYDTQNQYNIVTDSIMSDATKFTSVGGTDSIAGGFYQVLGDGSLAYIATYRDSSTVDCITGHTVFLRVNARVRDAVCQKIELMCHGSTGGTTLVADTELTPTADQWYTMSGNVTLDAGTTGYIRFYLKATYADAATASGKKLEAQYLICDDTSFSISALAPPTALTYNAYLPALGWFSLTNPTNGTYTYPNLQYTSPAFQVRPSAKKTLANIWLTIDTTNASSSSLLYVYWKSDNNAYAICYVDPTIVKSKRNLKIRVPVKEMQKAEWVQLKVTCGGDVLITGITLDWRVTERVK